MLGTTQEVELDEFMIEDSKLPTIIVPARLASTRFPGKLLSMVQGKPLILWTAQRISEVAPEFNLFFAADGDEIGDVLEASGFSVVKTDPSLASGTDRIAAANLEILADAIINVQADEPRIDRSHLLALSESLKPEGTLMSTLAVKFSSEEDFHDPNQVKVVCDQHGNALYFTRSSIPYSRGSDWQWREVDGDRPLKHLGLYGYKSEFLKRFSMCPEGKLEKIEKLEQLRVLELGEKISVSVVETETHGIDTPEDLARFVRLLENR